jgi:hypothetical protein
MYSVDGCAGAPLISILLLKTYTGTPSTTSEPPELQSDILISPLLSCSIIVFSASSKLMGDFVQTPPTWRKKLPDALMISIRKFPFTTVTVCHAGCASFASLAETIGIQAVSSAKALTGLEKATTSSAVFIGFM